MPWRFVGCATAKVELVTASERVWEAGIRMRRMWDSDKIRTYKKELQLGGQLKNYMENLRRGTLFTVLKTGDNPGGLTSVKHLPHKILKHDITHIYLIKVYLLFRQ